MFKNQAYSSLYVKKEKDWTFEEDIIGQMIQLKPHIARKEADEALGYLKIIEETAVRVKLL